MSRRYRQTMKGTFFGDFVYDQVIPPSHFLMQLDKVVHCLPPGLPRPACPGGQARGQASRPALRQDGRVGQGEPYTATLVASYKGKAACPGRQARERGEVPYYNGILPPQRTRTSNTPYVPPTHALAAVFRRSC